MSNNSTLALPQNGGNLVYDRIDFDQEKRDVIKNQICKGGTQAEYEMFIEVSKLRGLNPLTKQIYFVKYGSQAAAFVVSIDGLRGIAKRTGCYSPGAKLSEFVYDQNNQLVSATAYVLLWVPIAQQWMEIPEEATFDEFCQKNQQGKPTGKWATMPRVMLAKCAEARALRRAFPEETGGLYIQEEIDQAQNAIHVEATEVSGPPVGRQSVKPAATNEPIVFRTKTHEGKRPDELTTKDLEKYIKHWDGGASVRPQLRAAVEDILGARKKITALVMAAQKAGLSMDDRDKEARLTAVNAWLLSEYDGAVAPIESFNDFQTDFRIAVAARKAIEMGDLFWPSIPTEDAPESDVIEAEIVEAETEVAPVAEADTEPDDGDPNIFDSEE